MSNSTNINTLTSIINSLWEMEIKELDLGKADKLYTTLYELRAIKENMIAEREKRLQKNEVFFSKRSFSLKTDQPFSS